MCNISIIGHGSIHVVPDVTRIEITVQSVFPTYNEAYSQAKANASWVGNVLEYNKLDSKLAKTTKFDISDHLESEYDEDGHYIGQIKNGFDLEQRFKIDLGMDNVLLNKIVRGIGKFVPDTQINIGYTIKDPRPHQLKMLKRAVEDALEKAEIMAKAAGCFLGKVENIRYDIPNVTVYSQARNIKSNDEAKASTADSLDITPDDLVMSDDVRVSWALRQGDYY